MPKIILIILVLLSIFIIYQRLRPRPPLSTVTLTIKDQPFSLEIAKTPSQKSKGLSSRSSLCTNCGMIFIFDREGTYPFWMKDTLIPLDMIWLDQNGRIVTIHTASPEPDTPITSLKFYQNSSPAQYVIELNAGQAQKLGLRPNQTIELPEFK